MAAERMTPRLDALARITAGERFDVILCDLMMPHMTGMDLHAALAGAVPEQAERMIFMTGGAFTPSARARARSSRKFCFGKSPAGSLPLWLRKTTSS